MRISDWSSDVCSSDLAPWMGSRRVPTWARPFRGAPHERDSSGEIRLDSDCDGRQVRPMREGRLKPTDIRNPDVFHKVVDCQWACPAHTPVPEYILLIAAGSYTDAYMVKIGRASCRERVCQHLES